jgi:PEP-CTERM motif
MRKYLGLIALLFALIVAPNAHADNLTYVWTGNNGVTGFFSLDSTAFTSPSTFEGIFESSLTAFLLTSGTYTFDFADINLGSVIYFNSTVNPPTYLDGGGYAATDSVGDKVSFNGSQLYVFPAGGSQTLFSTGDFVVVASTVPEPGTVSLIGLGLLGTGLARRFRRRPLW